MAFPIFVQFHGAQLPITVQRRQHPVGQGGFHSAQLTTPDHLQMLVWDQFETWETVGKPNLTWIYDCGSEDKAAVDTEVEAYLDGSRPWIEFLFISHLDNDHINGLPRLLRRGDAAQVGTIALPYIDHVERLIIFARAVSEGALAEDDDGEFFRQMIFDPTQALARFNPRRLLYFRSGPDAEDSPDFGLDGGPGDRDGEAVRWKLIGPRRSRPEGHRLPGSSTAGHRAVDVSVVRDTATIDCDVSISEFGWIFKPYVRPISAALLSAFETAAITELKWTGKVFATEVADPMVRQDLVADAEKAASLAKAYEAACKGKKNRTSLCVYAGPAPEDISLAAPGTPEPLAYVVEPRLKVSRYAVGWLGTGDAELKAIKWHSDFIKHYAQEIGRVLTLQLPHHGSIHNFHSTLLSLGPRTCVASASPKNPNWEHPSDEVVKAVEGLPASFAHVTYSDDFFETILIPVP